MNPCRTQPLVVGFVLLLSLCAPAGAQDSAPDRHPIRHAEHQAGDVPPTPRDTEMVIGVALGGEARAYPLHLLWDENAHTVNDRVGQAAIAVALCPLAGAPSVFSRRVGRREVEIGHMLAIRNDILVLYDSASGSRWELLTGEAFAGPLEGRRLDRVPYLVTTWGRWKSLHPTTTVYAAPDEAKKGYQLDAALVRGFVQSGSGPMRDNDWIVGLMVGDVPVAVLLRSFAERRVRNLTIDEQAFVVFITEDLATTPVWRRRVGGRTLTFTADGDRMLDVETGSSWDAVTGRALTGPLKGSTLTAVWSLSGFWKAWKTQHPETRLITAETGD